MQVVRSVATEVLLEGKAAVPDDQKRVDGAVLTGADARREVGQDRGVDPLGGGRGDDPAVRVLSQACGTWPEERCDRDDNEQQAASAAVTAESHERPPFQPTPRRSY